MASKEIDYDSGSSFDSDSDSDDGAAMTFNLLEQANAKAFESSSHTLHHCKKLGGGLGKKKNKKNKGMLGGQNLFSSPRPTASESDLNEDGGDGDGDEGGFMSFGVTTETKLEGGNHQREEAKVEVEENAGASWDHGRRSHHEGVNPDHAAAAVAAGAAAGAAAAEPTRCNRKYRYWIKLLLSCLMQCHWVKQYHLKSVEANHSQCLILMRLEKVRR